MGRVDHPSARVPRLTGMTAGGLAQCRLLPAHSPDLKGTVELQQTPRSASLATLQSAVGGRAGRGEAV